MNFSSRLKLIRLSMLLTLLVLGIVGMVNVISERHFLRLDLTEDRAFSLHSASKDLLKNLDDLVTVKVFFSKELPPNLMAVRQYVQDLLQEMASYSQGNLALQFLDPGDDEVAKYARDIGIPPIRMNILSKDKYEVREGFLGLALFYGNKHEALPVIQDTANLEYDLAAGIRKLTQGELLQVGFTTGHNEYPIIARGDVSGGEGHVLANAALTKNYFVRSVDLNTPDALDKLDTLIIGGPETAFTLHEQYLLDQYLMKGGNIVFLVDGVAIQDFVQGKPLEVSLNTLLTFYGVRVEPGLVLDAVNETATLSSGGADVTVPYPFWVKAVKDYMARENPIVSKLEAVIFPWPSPLTLLPQDQVKATTLIQTSPGAWVQENLLDLNPEAVPLGLTQPYPLAVLLEGPFKSFFAANRRLPADFVGEANGRGRIVVIGNSRFLTDRMVRQYKQNLTFFLNTIDYLTLDQSLISVRSGGLSERPLLALSDAERPLIKWGGILLLPTLIFLYGSLRYFERKKKTIKL